MTYRDICKNCHGLGMVNQKDMILHRIKQVDCPTCGGTGLRDLTGVEIYEKETQRERDRDHQEWLRSTEK